MTINTYDLNLVPGVYAPVIVNVSQYDAGARDIQMRLYNDAMPFNIPQTAGVTVQGTKADDTGFQYPCEFEGNVVTWTVADQMTVFSGVIVCELKIVEGDEVLGTANFTLAVEPTALRDDTVISETDLPLLQIAADVAAYAPAVARDARMAADAAEQAAEVLQTVTDAVDLAVDAKTSSQASATSAASSASAAASSASDAAASATAAATSAEDAAESAEIAQQGANIAKSVENKSGSGAIEFGIDSTTGKGQYRSAGATDWIPFLSEFPGEFEFNADSTDISTLRAGTTINYNNANLSGYSEAVIVLCSNYMVGTMNFYNIQAFHPTRNNGGTWAVGNPTYIRKDGSNVGGPSVLSFNNNNIVLRDVNGGSADMKLTLKGYVVAGIGGKNE